MRLFKNSILVLGLILVVFALPHLACAEDSRYASLVIDADTGVVLHQESAGKIRYPASLTKMMTIYLTFQTLERGSFTMNTQLKVSAFAAGQKPSIIGFRPGQTISVQDALNAVIIKSANDAAVVLAEAIGSSEKQFATKMTKMAKSLGMNNTVFANASGLPDNRQVTTAYDLARLAIALRRDYPQYYPMFAKENFTYGGRTFHSHNRVTKSYRGADGLKTGYIRASGFNLVTSARRGDKSLIGVVMGGRSIKSRDTNMVKLLDQAFYQMSKGNVKNTRTKDDETDNTPFQPEEEDDETADAKEASKVAPARIQAPKNKITSVDFNKLTEIKSVSQATNGQAGFSRDVEVKNDPSVPAPKLRRDIFSPGVNVAAINKEAASDKMPSAAALPEHRPIRIMVRGRMVPLPTLRPTPQENSLVNTIILPQMNLYAYGHIDNLQNEPAA